MKYFLKVFCRQVFLGISLKNEHIHSSVKFMGETGNFLDFSLDTFNIEPIRGDKVLIVILTNIRQDQKLHKRSFAKEMAEQTTIFHGHCRDWKFVLVCSVRWSQALLKGGAMTIDCLLARAMGRKKNARSYTIFEETLIFS